VFGTVERPNISTPESGLNAEIAGYGWGDPVFSELLADVNRRSSSK